MIVEVGEAAACTAVEDGIAIQCQRSIVVDAEAGGGWPLDWIVKLELVVGDDFAGTLVLVGEDTVLEGSDRVGVADGWTLVWNVRCDVVGSDFKGTRVILIATAGPCLCRDGRGQGGDEGSGDEVFHDDYLKC